MERRRIPRKVLHLKFERKRIEMTQNKMGQPGCGRHQEERNEQAGNEKISVILQDTLGSFFHILAIE